MKTAAVLAVVCFLLLTGTGRGYQQSPAEPEKKPASTADDGTAKSKATDETKWHVSKLFRERALHILVLLDSPDAHGDDLTKAMSMAQTVSTNIADTAALAVLHEYDVARFAYSGHDSDKKARDTCRAIAHSLIEDEARASREAIHPCLAAVNAQLQEQKTARSSQTDKTIDQPAEPYEVKGVKLGSLLTDWKATHARDCDDSSAMVSKPGEFTCVVVNASYAGVSAIELVNFYHGRLATFTFQFSSDKFAILRNALTEKFGPPVSEKNNKYRNAYGATFEGATLTWDNGVSGIQLNEISGEKNRGLLIFVHLQTVKEQEKDNKVFKKDDM